ncbi:UDP-glucose dehydrogenase family protein [Campylobacter troglodytis]|uniref:UDP-glucose dehydrogenase family protein n=1 Tax=Campylobacter troglodytis TaxID=654363 RepID=UPI0011572968|nr:UDP-glucose/GDP-mannose dehydrogenase family protein [Campylobacter troglodytis]TQR55827.1 UDP-glucose 6-dehydrogenase [Campylobacter troglodytis]
MRIAIIGSGYVGLVAGACFAQMGNSVICLDNDENKIAHLKQGKLPIYEPGLAEMIKDNVNAGRLSFSTDVKETISSSKIIFITVGMPMGEAGSADLRFVRQVVSDIAKCLSMPNDEFNRYKNSSNSYIIVVKSTVAIGTARKLKAIIAGKLAKCAFKAEFAVVSNPEFLREGLAIKDFMSPDRIIIGTDGEEWALQTMHTLYAPFLVSNDRFITMSMESAEMTKYAANSMLATKISFINEMSQICERVGADINDVRRGIGSDTRIGHSFIYPGCGYGGSCLPKDIKALEKIALDKGYTPCILQAVQAVNVAQKMLLVEKITAKFGQNLQGFEFALWGLSFKPQTDDTREASSLTLVRELVKRGAKVKAFDPKAQEQAQFYLRDVLNSITFCQNQYETLLNADAMVLVTEWKEFYNPDFEAIKKALKKPIIFDGRNIYHKFNLAQKGFEYHQIGVKSKK